MRAIQAVAVFAPSASAAALLQCRRWTLSSGRRCWALAAAKWPGRGSCAVAPRPAEAVHTSSLTSARPTRLSVNWNIRYGLPEGNGTYVGAYGLRIQVTDPYGQPAGHPVVYYQTGAFSKNCRQQPGIHRRQIGVKLPTEPTGPMPATAKHGARPGPSAANHRLPLHPRCVALA